MDGWVGGWMDGCMDGWVGGIMYLFNFCHSNSLLIRFKMTIKRDKGFKVN